MHSLTDAPRPTHRITFSQEGVLIGAIELGADVETRLEDAVVAESVRAGVGIAEWGQIACYDVWFVAESDGEALPEGLREVATNRDGSLPNGAVAAIGTGKKVLAIDGPDLAVRTRVAAIKGWDGQDAGRLLSLLKDLKAEVEHTDEHIDLGNMLFSHQVPDDIAGFPVWAVDAKGRCIAGDAIDDFHVTTVEEVRDAIAEIRAHQVATHRAAG
ncbi:hypothetical protein [Azospirillum brasilense]|uniref:Uncharacterized protein n=1 Tax=Azospirillum brasilense TaxID=192 RepID=A0A6L3B1N8_AZOBR|nr:hypothetical protein [Azospirillum brasilense]KAA0686183.1 hypothetical protein DS837_10825 [Azospirillum brasilense]